MPESADEHTNFGKPREGPKTRQTATGAAQLKTSTGKTPPFSAKASPAKNRASGRRGTPISPVIKASTSRHDGATGTLFIALLFVGNGQAVSRPAPR
jgi:hypothetical protein